MTSPSAGVPVTLLILGSIAVAMAILAIPASRWLASRGGSMRTTLGLSGGMALSGGLLWGVFELLGLNIEQHGIWMWIWVGITAVIVGAVSAARHHRVPTVELVMATIAVLELTTLLLVITGDDPGLSDPPVRALLVAPAALGLGAYFGASIGYLLWGDHGDADFALGYEATVGRRFLLSKASSVLSTVTTISVVGVALGVWLVIVALAILSGFEFDLQSKIIGANAHIALQRDGGRTFAMPEGVLDRIDAVEGVVASSPFLQGEVAIASSSNFTGALLSGIDPIRGPQVLDVLSGELPYGSLRALREEGRDPVDEAPLAPGAHGLPPPAPMPNVIIGIEMKKSLNVKEGDRLTVLSPLLENLTPLGPVPASRPFRAAGVFSSKMYEFDARFAYAGIAAVRRFFQTGERQVSGIHIRVDDPVYADRVGARVAAALGAQPCPSGGEARFDCGWEALDWKSRNQTLFAALKLERVVAFVVLVFIILVASFSIVNTLTMSVIEKQKEIAILKTMGARDVGIMKLFLVQGMAVGVFGTILGATGAVLTVAALETFGFWIPGAVYYIDSLPVHLEMNDVVLVVLAALLIVWDFAVFPALRGSQLEPVEGLRDG